MYEHCGEVGEGGKASYYEKFYFHFHVYVNDQNSELHVQRRRWQPSLLRACATAISGAMPTAGEKVAPSILTAGAMGA